MTAVPVTTVFASMYAILLIALTAWVGLYRGKIEVNRGDGNDPVLHKRIRVHANLTEVAPAFALTLLAAELLGLSQAWLWLGVVSFAVGRVGHYVLYDSSARGFMMLITLLPAVFFGLWCLVALSGAPS